MEIPNIKIGCDPELFLSRHNPDIEKLLEADYAKYMESEKKFLRKIKPKGMDEEEYFKLQLVPWDVWKNPHFGYYNQNFYKDTFVSAHGMVPGTKLEPFKVDGGAVQVDGVALEFNINPASTAKEFQDNIRTVLKEMRDIVDIAAPGLDFKFTPTAKFEEGYWKTIPDEAKVLGCEPDFDGYSLEANPRPSTDKPFRTASGHIHVSWTDDKVVTDGAHMNDCGLFAKQMDMAVGVFSMLWDTDRERRLLYGKPGTFRPKRYGMEYRALSNKWVEDPFLQARIFHNSKRALKMLFRGKYLPAMFPTVSQTIQKHGFEYAYNNSEMFLDMETFLKENDWLPFDEKDKSNKSSKFLKLR